MDDRGLSGFFGRGRIVLLLLFIAVLTGCGSPVAYGPKPGVPAGPDVILLSTMSRTGSVSPLFINKQLYAFDISSGQACPLIVDAKKYGLVLKPSLSPDRRNIAYERGSIELRPSYPLELTDSNGEHHRELAQTGGRPGFFSWRPDGKGVYYLTGDGNINFVDLEGRIERLGDLPEEDKNVRFSHMDDSLSPNGAYLASLYYHRDRGTSVVVRAFNSGWPGPVIASARMNTKFGALPLPSSPVWLSDVEIMVFDQEIKERQVTLESGEKRSAEIAYRIFALKWNFIEGTKTRLFESEPLEAFREPSASPDRDAIAFLYCMPEYDSTKEREFKPGHEPNPAVFDLKTGTIKRIKVRLESGPYVITGLGW